MGYWAAEQGRWTHRDRFGRRWRWSLGDAGGSRRDASLDAAFLVYFAFNAAGAVDPQAARVLLDVYESVAMRRAREVDRRALEETLRRAVEMGQLRLERIIEHLELPPGHEEPEPPTTPSPGRPDETRWFSLTVLDDVGDPIDGLDIAYSFAGERHVVATNGAGEARLEGVTGTRMDANLVSIDAARAKLKPRWTTPREAKIDATSLVRMLASPIDAVPLESEVPATLVLTPFFECHEVAGPHFEFGRSFVRSAAFESLARIGEALSGDDDRKAMIFGHTDLSGSEALNKELSERRARAVFALFTHDTDAWEALFSGTEDGKNWKEKWDLEEAQHMLNTLGCGADDDNPINEKGIRDAATKQAIHRFQRGDYHEKPAEQAPLEEADLLGKDGRKELFLAYAKRISRKPVDAARFSQIGGSRFMGCGELNPLSLSAKDAESRRANVFVFDPAAEPQGLPCKLRDLGPCNANITPALKEPDPDGKPPFRCKVFKEVASKCPCNGGADISHDLVVRFPFSLDAMDGLRHVLIVESDDGTITQRRTLKDDARALDPTESELSFNHLPPAHAYRMRAEGIDEPYEVFGFTPFEKLSGLSGIDSILEGQLAAAALEVERVPAPTAPPDSPPPAPAPKPGDIPF